MDFDWVHHFVLNHHNQICELYEQFVPCDRNIICRPQGLLYNKVCQYVHDANDVTNYYVSNTMLAQELINVYQAYFNLVVTLRSYHMSYTTHLPVGL